MRRWPVIIVRYALAVAAAALATVARAWLVQSVGPMPLFITWYPAVLLVATVAGGGPGIATTLLCVLAADYWFIDPVGGLGYYAPNDAVAVGIFTGSGLLISILAERLSRARRAEAISQAQEQELALLDMGNLAALDLEHRIVRWSQGCRRLYGFENSEALGQPADKLLETRFPLPAEEIHRTLLEKGHWEGEVSRRGKSGSELALALLWALRRDQQGRPQAILEVSTDMTRQKKAEDELREQSEDLARSNKDLEQFAYVASHDLQEPLRMVTAYMQLFARKYQDRIDAQAEQYIKFAVEGSTRMSMLVQDLLAYSRASRADIGVEPVWADQVLDRVLANLKLTIEEAGAKVAREPLPTVQADPTQLAQLFQNLISNSLKFRHPDRRPEIHVGCLTEGDHREFFVRDNGIGIAPEHHEKVFQVFQRLHTREKYPGTGIGLAICKKIVERHGGRIWLESTTGEGTTFRFTLTA